MEYGMNFISFSPNATESLLNSRADNLTEEENKYKRILYKLSTQIQYFRTHAELHQWLSQKWLEQHPDKEKDDFRNIYLEITPEILKDMTAYAKKGKHEKATGFFWGESSKEEWQETRELCQEIKEIQDSGFGKVFYCLNW